MLNTSDLTIEVLSEKNQPNDFDCNDEDLNDFIINDALITQENRIAITNLVFNKDSFVGFFSLACDSINLDKSEVKRLRVRGRRYPEYPALKIARLGVCKNHQRCGIGKFIFSVVLGLTVEELQPKIGVRFISVDAYSQSLDFYKNLGFISSAE